MAVKKYTPLLCFHLVFIWDTLVQIYQEYKDILVNYLIFLIISKGATIVTLVFYLNKFSAKIRALLISIQISSASGKNFKVKNQTDA